MNVTQTLPAGWSESTRLTRAGWVASANYGSPGAIALTVTHARRSWRRSAAINAVRASAAQSPSRVGGLA